MNSIGNSMLSKTDDSTFVVQQYACIYNIGMYRMMMQGSGCYSDMTIIVLLFTYFPIRACKVSRVCASDGRVIFAFSILPSGVMRMNLGTSVI